MLIIPDKNEEGFFPFILYCSRLIVTLDKLLMLDNKNEKISLFILYCSRLIVTLQGNNTKRK